MINDDMSDPRFVKPEGEIIDDSQYTGAALRLGHSVFRALLFPANLTGLGHIAVFTVCFLLLVCLRAVSLGYTRYAVGFLNLLVTLELISYFYLCVRESAVGAVMAPDSLLTGSPDCNGFSATLGGYFSLYSEYLSSIMPFLICFLPAILYPMFVDDVNWNLFILMLSIGIFYFPMFFLAVVMFDSSSGYNPWVHFVSIISTFFSYCVLVFQFSVVAALIVMTGVFLSRSHWVFGLLTLPMTLYLVMVFMHLLGRFFYKHEEKLRWDV